MCRRAKGPAPGSKMGWEPQPLRCFAFWKKPGPIAEAGPKTWAGRWPRLKSGANALSYCRSHQRPGIACSWAGGPVGSPLFFASSSMPLLRFIPDGTNINFVGARYVAFAIDGLLLLISIVSIFWQGFNYGIDFTGGVLIEVKAAHVIDIGKIRQDIGTLGFGDSQIQYYGGAGECDHP